jgi:hypothetical protein
VGVGAFFLSFRTHEREAKKRAQNHEEKERDKSKSAEERIRAFSSLLHWKPGSRTQRRSAGGKRRFLSKRVRRTVLCVTVYTVGGLIMARFAEINVWEN